MVITSFFLNIDQQDEIREHGESNFKTLASLRPHYTIGKVYAYVPTYTHYCFVRNTFRKKRVLKFGQFKENPENITFFFYILGDCAAGHRAENRDKNRNVLVVPPDDNRPYLTSFQSNSTTDYINAVFVDGFCQAEAMIVTEWPMQSTVANFWSMVYDHDCSTGEKGFGDLKTILLADREPNVLKINNLPM